MQWVKIGRQGIRRSLWAKVIMPANANELTLRSEAEAIELRAGREGDDADVRIDRTNPQFDAILLVVLTAICGIEVECDD